MKFTTPLHITGTPEQLKVVEDGLVKLGYKNHVTCQRQYLITEIKYSRFMRTDTPCISTETPISASNPDLVLALAAQTEGEDWIVGEWLVFKNREKIFKVRELSDRSWEDGLADNHYKNFYRKATKEEIIKHFNNMAHFGDKKVPSYRDETREIIGYKFKEGFEKYREQAEQIAQYLKSDFPLESYLYPSRTITRNLQEAGVLDLWFEPVYKEKYKVGDWVTGFSDWCKGETFEVVKITKQHFGTFLHKTKGANIDVGKVRHATPEEIAAAQKKVITLRHAGGTFEVEVSKEGIYYAPDKTWLDPQEIRATFDTSFVVTRYKSKGNYTFKASHIDSGCMKAVPVYDWMKVLDAYESLK